MNETQWLLDQAKQLADAASDYPKRAQFLALADFIQAQAMRLEQAEGELDGRAWDHEQW
ncbi:hypothetical protein ACFQ5J_11750 [Lacticaseibacillus baoqingensis]|uniref:Uncharacterized protein n=1 Tax=Lacticaseibacillus baoqingensis TaxID=2486013 RepID=A0ABW4EBX9_9LACO|nr:hypothetical protein [Lacticaseibacillus baoqingensis]